MFLIISIMGGPPGTVMYPETGAARVDVNPNFDRARMTSQNA
jgi:hypothetical protein